MVRLQKIYTRGGDGGETSIAGGARRSKADPRIEAIGAVDEANAAIGLACTGSNAAWEACLARIQNDLFDLGADLARPERTGGEADGGLRVTSAQTAWLENEIDALNEELAPLESFVLPGGSELSARLHLARTIVRRAERRVAALAAREEINSGVLIYLNRLSDLLFQMARMANDGGKTDILWVPGENR